MNEHTDTRLTDYALGELPEAERLQTESRLRDDAAARGEVEETQRLAGMLRAALPAAASAGDLPPSSELRESLRERLLAAAPKSPASLRERVWAVAAIGIGIAVAASLAVVLHGDSRSPGDDGMLVVVAPSRSQAVSIKETMSPPAGTLPNPIWMSDDAGIRSAGRKGDSWELLTERRRKFALTPPSSESPPAKSPALPTAATDSFGTGTVKSGSGTLDLKGTHTFTQPGPPTSASALPFTTGSRFEFGAVNTRPQIPAMTTPATIAISDGAVPADVAGSIILSPTPMALGEKLIKQGAGTLNIDPHFTSPVPPLPSPSTSDSGGGEASREMFPLLLAHQEAVAKYGQKHPKALEIEMKLRAVSERIEQPTVSKPRLTVRNRADVAATRFDVDHDGDGEADTRWIDLGRPAKPEELADFQSLTNLITSDIRPETWREVKTVEDLERRLSEHDADFDFKARLDSLRRHDGEMNTEQYQAEPENPFVRSTDAPLSTFSIDVDTASYSNVRRYLEAGQLPPPSAVRLEEFLNYFTYDYPTPIGDVPFSVTTEAARCPWNADHVLLRVGLKGREVHRKERPASNLVFLVDVSGSMQDQNKLPLVRESLKMLVGELGDDDRVSMVVYAGSSGLVLPPTGGDRKRTILEAIDRLEAGGSTNGAAGIQLAYQLAADHFIPKGINRVILATDGDFNVGVTSQGELVKLIEEKAKTGVFFSALGYGMGNLKDSTLESLADKGNGNYAYIDTIGEARKVLVEQMSGTLMTIAKDVKIQIEFNPTTVAGYRLLGYENRMLAAQDFNDDKKDAGEIGAGHTVTALYELIPAGKSGTKETKKLPEVDPLKYQTSPVVAEQSKELAGELLTLKLRYKQPDGDKSSLIEQVVKNDVPDYGRASADFKFASAVAGFGMILRGSKYYGSATLDGALELAGEGIGRDEGGYRKEFVELVRKAKELRKK